MSFSLPTMFRSLLDWPGLSSDRYGLAIYGRRQSMDSLNGDGHLVHVWQRTRQGEEQQAEEMRRTLRLAWKFRDAPLWLDGLPIR